MDKPPCIEVPVDLFLTLARLYKEQAQEFTVAGEYQTVHLLEQRAYRKRLQFKRGPLRSKARSGVSTDLSGYKPAALAKPGFPVHNAPSTLGE